VVRGANARACLAQRRGTASCQVKVLPEIVKLVGFDSSDIICPKLDCSPSHQLATLLHEALRPVSLRRACVFRTVTPVLQRDSVRIFDAGRRDTEAWLQRNQSSLPSAA
jgi:hypothetical protein